MVFKRFLTWLKPYKAKFLFGWLLIIICQASRMILPRITGMIVDDVIPQGDMQLLLKLCAIFVGLSAGRAAIVYVRGMLFESVSQSVVYDLRTKMYSHMQELSYSFYDKNHVGEIMSRMTGDIDGVRNLVMNFSVAMFESLLMFLFAIISMALLSWQLALVMFLFCPLLAAIAWKLRSLIAPAHRVIREQNAVLNTRTQENIAGVRVVKAFAREEYEKERFSEDNLKVLEDNLVVTRIWSKYYPILDMAAGFTTPVLILVGALLVSTGTLGLGSLVAAIGYVWMIVDPMRQLAQFVNMTTNGLTSCEKLIYYMDFGSEIKNPEKTVEPSARRGAVEFRNVSFRYGKNQVLRDICLSVKPGESVAVMGATGTGKSTFVTLLGRYYDIGSGSLLVDGVDVRQQDLHSLRRSIGEVMQETFLFSDSISANIAFGRPEATMDEIIAAAKVAQADEFIREMPQGYDTIVGERGLGLSGGQKQRIALARAICTNPQILVLDDATSAIDMETEAEIQKALGTVMKGRTTFIIAHRISSVRNADLIVVLDNNTIAERGTHRELLEKNGLYAQMYRDQTSQFTETFLPDEKGGEE